MTKFAEKILLDLAKELDLKQRDFEQIIRKHVSRLSGQDCIRIEELAHCLMICNTGFLATAQRMIRAEAGFRQGQ
jgi:hypothetical protein